MKLYTEGDVFIGCKVYKDDGSLYGTLYRVGTKMFSVRVSSIYDSITDIDCGRHIVYHPIDCLTQKQKPYLDY
jgi:hypothetical protein